jgi:hypothetical protein
VIGTAQDTYFLAAGAALGAFLIPPCAIGTTRSTMIQPVVGRCARGVVLQIWLAALFADSRLKSTVSSQPRFRTRAGVVGKESRFHSPLSAPPTPTFDLTSLTTNSVQPTISNLDQVGTPSPNKSFYLVVPTRRCRHVDYFYRFVTRVGFSGLGHINYIGCRLWRLATRYEAQYSFSVLTPTCRSYAASARALVERLYPNILFSRGVVLSRCHRLYIFIP